MKSEWKQVGVAVLSKSGWAISIGIGDDWYSIPVEELRRVLNGYAKVAKVSTIVSESHSG